MEILAITIKSVLHLDFLQTRSYRADAPSVRPPVAPESARAAAAPYARRARLGAGSLTPATVAWPFLINQRSTAAPRSAFRRSRYTLISRPQSGLWRRTSESRARRTAAASTFRGGRAYRIAAPSLVTADKSKQTVWTPTLNGQLVPYPRLLIR
mgnify:CR=1 FL=1